MSMPTRLDSRSRSFSRSSSSGPAGANAGGLNTTAAKIKLSREVPVTLSDLPDGDEDEWEPESDEPALTLEQIRDNIQTWEHDLNQKGRPISGRTM